ncbi:hypothetical protein K8R42_00195 [bacterium]|nr:hypothetical protein [bacterium]
MFKTKNLDFATLILLIIVAFILVTYVVVAVWYWQNSKPLIINHWKVIDKVTTSDQQNKLYCQSDDDCTIQFNCCPCPHIPINIYNITKVDCPPDIACTMEYCGKGEAYCENNTCKVKSSIQQAYQGGEKPDEYLGQVITLSGTIATDILQHPQIILMTETHYEYHYIDTDFGQIQALRGDRIKCDDQIKITGTIHGLGSSGEEGKKSYQGYYMMVSDYECL